MGAQPVTVASDQVGHDLRRRAQAEIRFRPAADPDLEGVAVVVARDDLEPGIESEPQALDQSKETRLLGDDARERGGDFRAERDIPKRAEAFFAREVI